MTATIKIIYFSASLHLLSQHQKRLEKLFSHIEEVSLNWLKHLLLAMLIMAFTSLLIDVLRMLVDVPHSFKITIHVTATLITIYILSFFGMRQPIIFTHSTRALLEVIEKLEAIEKLEVIEKQGQLTTEDKNRPKEKYQKSKIDNQTKQKLWQNFNYLMTEEKLFLKPKITLSAVAEAMNVSPAHLSQVINAEGERTFYEIINEYKVNEAIHLLTKSSSKIKMSTVAMEAGFQSQSTFYKHFKKVTGVSPKQYLEQMQNLEKQSN